MDIAKLSHHGKGDAAEPYGVVRCSRPMDSRRLVVWISTGILVQVHGITSRVGYCWGPPFGIMPRAKAALIANNLHDFCRARIHWADCLGWQINTLLAI